MREWIEVIDWSVLLTSGLVSALVGGLVSLGTIHQMTVRRVRAERVETARRNLSKEAGRRKRELERHSVSAYPKAKREDPKTYVLDDINICYSLFVQAIGVGRWRARMNRLRLEKLFGSSTVAGVSMFRDFAEDDENGNWTVVMWTQRRMGEADLDVGEWHLAWCAAPGSKIARSAVRRLSRLERSSVVPW